MLAATSATAASVKHIIQNYQSFNKNSILNQEESFQAWIERTSATETQPARPSVRREASPLTAAVNTAPPESFQPLGSGWVYGRGVRVVSGSPWRSTSTPPRATPLSAPRVPNAGERPAAPVGQYLDVLA